MFFIPNTNATQVVKISEPTHRLSDGVFFNDLLAQKLTPTGSLGQVVYSNAFGVNNWLVDPATIDEIIAMSNGYGIAEQHAVTSAAGLAYAGMHPVIAIYSTFLNRAFDQLLLDVALHKAGVTFVLDRAGITGDDGPSHHGIWDLALTGIVPNMHVGAPRDGARLKEILRECVAIENAPSMVRFPKGAVPADIPAVQRVDGIDILHRGLTPQVLVISVGSMAGMAIEVAQLAKTQSIEITVVDPLWVKPISPAVIALCANYSTVVVMEDGIKHAGIASTISEALRNAGTNCSLHSIGVPLEFIEHSKRAEILEDLEITPAAIVQQISGWIS